jgi:hypothetical protein
MIGFQYLPHYVNTWLSGNGPIRSAIMRNWNGSARVHITREWWL